MNQSSRKNTVAVERAETPNPLWIITIVMAIFFGVATILVAWG